MNTRPERPARAPSAATRIRAALDHANAHPGSADHADLHDALALLHEAREDLDTLEVALLLVARAEGMTWPAIADALGLRSPQAAQQRARRLAERDSVAVNR
jgi:hypothetical protein